MDPMGHGHRRGLRTDEAKMFGDEESCERDGFQQRTVRVRAGEGSVEEVDTPFPEEVDKMEVCPCMAGPFHQIFLLVGGLEHEF